MKKFLIAAMLMVCASVKAQAAFFVDPATFSAANPGLPTLDFEGITGSFDFVGSFAAPNLTITSPTNDIVIFDSSMFFATPTDILFDNAFGGGIILTFGPGVSAVGFNAAVGFSGGVGSFEVYNGLTLLDSQSLALANQNLMTGFVGWSGLGDITSVVFRTDSSGFPLIDNLQYGRVALVPEPATVALFGVGLLGLGLLNRRRAQHIAAQ